MSIQVSVIIASFQRAHLLKWNLFSLSRQAVPWNFEVLVINDGIEDETEAICRMYKDTMNLQYIFSRQHNQEGEPRWRVPGFAYNIGAQLSRGEILIICCAEMFHINDTIKYLSHPLMDNPRTIGIPVVVKDDRDARFLQQLKDNDGEFDQDLFEGNHNNLNAHNPFLISVHRQEFFAIGGYDEDFTGIGWEDNDLASRLRHSGCQYRPTEAKTIHLYHPRFAAGKRNLPDYLYNERLYRERAGQIVRNQGRLWGRKVD